MLSALFNDPILVLYRIPALLLAISVHEAMHGYVAYKLGDPTAKMMGRLTLNPAKHLNIIGTAMLLLLGFGFATPVPVNARNFKKPRRDMALVALAGPLSNILLAIVGIVLTCAFSYLPIDQSAPIFSALYMLLSVFISLNIGFAVFNMLPIPPLDGFRVLFSFLPPKASFWVLQYEQYIQAFFFIALFLGVFDGVLSFLFGTVLGVLISIFAF